MMGQMDSPLCGLPLWNPTHGRSTEQIYTKELAWKRGQGS